MDSGLGTGKASLIADTLTARWLAGAHEAPTVAIEAAVCSGRKYIVAPEPVPGGPPPVCGGKKYISVPVPEPGDGPPACSGKKYIVAPEPKIMSGIALQVDRLGFADRLRDSLSH